MYGSNTTAPLRTRYQVSNSTFMTHSSNKSSVGLRVERRHQLQSVCFQDVVLVDQTNENRLGLSLDCKVDAVALTNQTLHLFGQLKQHLLGKHFADDNDVQHEALL
ncbi:hypothetical protein AVEN_258938-1 [Araneus ventricosus]|uniref:Uncharacterized protein n=1 Tax=Araneus ventricosus TaxID=182803 RepID=A0A4Y2CE63_ARAVE|nr:hypothetical protein AVEN_258938-1 [Araneus ventricosus]